MAEPITDILQKCLVLSTLSYTFHSRTKELGQTEKKCLPKISHLKPPLQHPPWKGRLGGSTVSNDPLISIFRQIVEFIHALVCHMTTNLEAVTYSSKGFWASFLDNLFR